MRGAFGWKIGCEKLVGIDTESKNSSGVPYAGLLKLELVSNTVWIKSSEFMCGELDEKLGLKRIGGRDKV